MNNLAVSEESGCWMTTMHFKYWISMLVISLTILQKSPFGANIAHSSLKILQKEMNKHFPVDILNKIKNKVMNAIK